MQDDWMQSQPHPSHATPAACVHGAAWWRNNNRGAPTVAAGWIVRGDGDGDDDDDGDGDGDKDGHGDGCVDGDGFGRGVVMSVASRH